MSDIAPMRAPDQAGPNQAGNNGLVVDRLRAVAEAHPHGSFLGLSYAEAWAASGGVASWLIAQGFGPSSRPVAIPSDQRSEGALMLFGALRAGVLATRRDDADPALVFAQDSIACEAALDRAAARGARIVTADGRRGIAFAALANCSIDAAVAERRLHIGADTPAVVLLDGTIRRHGDLASLADDPLNVGAILAESA